jgi:hypothetical protein
MESSERNFQVMDDRSGMGAIPAFKLMPGRTELLFREFYVFIFLRLAEHLRAITPVVPVSLS